MALFHPPTHVVLLKKIEDNLKILNFAMDDLGNINQNIFKYVKKHS